MYEMQLLMKFVLNLLHVYNLHQKNGFTCMLLGEIFELVYVSDPLNQVLLVVFNVSQILFLYVHVFVTSLCRQLLFVVGFTVFLANCVDYDVLFANKFVNHTDSSKVTLPDAILPMDVCSTQ